MIEFSFLGEQSLELTPQDPVSLGIKKVMHL